MVSLKIKEILCLIYSTLLFASGIILIGLSVVLFYKLFVHFNFVPSNALGPFIVIFILGFLHLFLTWLGVKGPTREHDLHIILFMVFTIILLILELTVGIWSMVIWEEVDVESLNLMRESFNEFITNSYDKKHWERMETKLKCCGLNGVEDYTNKKASIPVSCCETGKSNTTCPIYEPGCILPLTRYVKGVMIDGAIIGFLLCILQCLGVAIFFIYFKSLRHERVERRRQIMHRQSQENPTTITVSAATPPPTTPTTTSS